MRVIGIDPGVGTTGYAVVERAGGHLVPVAFGAIRTMPTERHEQRLAHLASDLRVLLVEHTPDHAAAERLFFNANVKTAMAVGQASGVVLATLAGAGLAVTEYTPPQVKQAVAGYGGAAKSQVQRMVATVLGLGEVPRPPDAADACALAICHINSTGLARAVAAAGAGP